MKAPCRSAVVGPTFPSGVALPGRLTISKSSRCMWWGVGRIPQCLAASRSPQLANGFICESDSHEDSEGLAQLLLELSDFVNISTIACSCRSTTTIDPTS
jgi:hypothetical protein